jgi:seryl-tRNA synthetase
VGAPERWYLDRATLEWECPRSVREKSSTAVPVVLACRLAESEKERERLTRWLDEARSTRDAAQLDAQRERDSSAHYDGELRDTKSELAEALARLETAKDLLSRWRGHEAARLPPSEEVIIKTRTFLDAFATTPPAK